MDEKNNKQESGKKRIVAPLPEVQQTEDDATQEASAPLVPTRGKKASKADYAAVSSQIINNFAKDPKRAFSKKEIVQFCNDNNIEMGNWSSLLKYLYRGCEAGKLQTDISRGPLSTYKIVSLQTPEKNKKVAKPAPKKPKITKKPEPVSAPKEVIEGVIIKGKKLSDQEYDTLTDELIAFMETLLIGELKKIEIVRFFKSKKAIVGDWGKFTDRLRRGNDSFEIITNGEAGQKCRYLLKAKPGAAQRAERKVQPVPPSTKARKSVPSPAPKRVVPSEKPAPEATETTLKIPAGDKPVSITIRIEIG